MKKKGMVHELKNKVKQLEENERWAKHRETLAIRARDAWRTEAETQRNMMLEIHGIVHCLIDQMGGVASIDTSRLIELMRNGQANEYVGSMTEKTLILKTIDQGEGAEDQKIDFRSC